MRAATAPEFIRDRIGGWLRKRLGFCFLCHAPAVGDVLGRDGECKRRVELEKRAADSLHAVRVLAAQRRADDCERGESRPDGLAEATGVSLPREELGEQHDQPCRKTDSQHGRENAQKKMRDCLDKLRHAVTSSRW